MRKIKVALAILSMTSAFMVGCGNDSAPTSTSTPTKAPTQATTEKTTEKATQKATQKATTASVKVGEYLKLGKYEQDNNKSNGKEDIEWLVLEVKENSAFVVSRYGLDTVRYNEPANGQYVYTDWEGTSLRKWLNEDFYSAAFSSSESKKIKVTNVKADANPEYSTAQGNDTKDKIFLLSAKEVLKYFPTKEDKICKITKYAKAQGIHEEDMAAWWWTRTLGGDDKKFATVDDWGEPFWVGNYQEGKDIAIRPAMWISLD